MKFTRIPYFSSNPTWHRYLSAEILQERHWHFLASIMNNTYCMSNEKWASRSQTESAIWTTTCVFKQKCLFVYVRVLTVSSSDWLSPFRLLCRNPLELPHLEILIRASRAFCQHTHTEEVTTQSTRVFPSQRSEFQSDLCWRSNSKYFRKQNGFSHGLLSITRWWKMQEPSKSTEPIPFSNSYAANMCTEADREKPLHTHQLKKFFFYRNAAV